MRASGTLMVGSVIAFLCLGLPCCSMGTVEPCNSSWVTGRRMTAHKTGQRFAIVDNTSFSEQGWSYLVGITYALQSDSLTLMVFGSPSGDPRPLFTQEIGILEPDMINPDKEPADSCPAPDFGPYFKVTVLDLDGDGSREIVVESNQLGGCAECKSGVSVYKVSLSKVNMVVDEEYTDISFAQGKGLSIDSFTTDAAGNVTPTHKTFFEPKASQPAS